MIQKYLMFEIKFGSKGSIIMDKILVLLVTRLVMVLAESISQFGFWFGIGSQPKYGFLS